MKLIYFLALFPCSALFYGMEQKNNKATQKLLKYTHYDSDALLLAQKKISHAKLWVNQNKAFVLGVALANIREKYPQLKNIHVAPNVLNIMIATQEQTKTVQKKIERLSKKFNTTLKHRQQFENLLTATLHPAVQCDNILQKYKKLEHVVVCKQNRHSYPTDIVYRKLQKYIWEFKFIENYFDVFADHLDYNLHVVSFNFKKKKVGKLITFIKKEVGPLVTFSNERKYIINVPCVKE